MVEVVEIVQLCREDEVPVGEIRQGSLPDGGKLAIYNVDGRLYVTDDLCTHGASSLSDEGTLEGSEVECGWHFGRFDVTTGKPTAMPCEVALKTYPTFVENGMICISLEPGSSVQTKAS